MSRPRHPLVVLLSVFAALHAYVVAQTDAQPLRWMPPRVCQAFDVTAGSIQHLALPEVALRPGGGDFELPLQLGGASAVVSLRPYEIRSPGYRLLERRDGGLHPVAAGPCTTYRGSLVGDATSRVAASVVAGELRAVILRQGTLWGVQPLRDGGVAAGHGSYAVFRGSDCVGNGGHCGLPTQPGGAAPVGADSVYECELALEADHALFLLNSSNALTTQADVLGVVNAVDAIYQNDVDVSFLVTQLIVDTSPDPYTTNVASTLLGQLRSYWNANHAAVTRDVVHLFSGRQIGAASAGTVGYAYQSSVCNLADAYGLSQTKWSSNYALRVGLTAHELGHNFGATHCDLTPGCNIMCSGIGGCSGVAASFGPNALGEMHAFLQAVGCLAVVPTVPQITSASPVFVETVQPPVVTLGGSGFLGTNLVTVGGQPVGNYQVVGDSMLQMVPPVGLNLGVQAVTVSNPAGTSNATFLIYQGSDPCRVIVPQATPANAPFIWNMGGWPNADAYLGVSLVDTTVPLQGFPVMQAFLTLWVGTLDARGMATVSMPAIPALLSGYPFYSQMLDVMSGTATIRSVSLVESTLVY